MIWSSKITNALLGCCRTRLSRSCRMCIRACSMPAFIPFMLVYHVAARYHSPCPLPSSDGGITAARGHPHIWYHLSGIRTFERHSRTHGGASYGERWLSGHGFGHAYRGSCRPVGEVYGPSVQGPGTPRP